MGRSPYRRGIPALLVGAGLLVVASVALALGSKASARAPLPPPVAEEAKIEAPKLPGELTPSRANDREVPVETTPPGAKVYDVTNGTATLLCPSTPCKISAGPDRSRDTIVSLELPGYASAQAHVKDVLDQPGGTLMLNFVARGSAPVRPREMLHIPTLRQGAIQVSPGLPPEVVMRIARQNFGRFRLCYENGLRTNPSLQGRVVAKLTIDPKGTVTSATDGGSDLPDPSVVACVLRAFSLLSMPQPDNGVTVTVIYPVLFNPGD